MNTGCALLGIIEGGAALLVVFLAYLIKYKKQVNIIAGYDERECKDKDGLTNWIGGTLMISGSICFLLAILVIALPNHTNLIMAFFGIVMVLGCMVATIGSNKYKF
ncbi:MAG: DUF3784 domain-containing protein [Mucilaginibacter sp.]|uniref:DUF3784 domain-containing protein n=1 Tax=Mucilaginibacter sp. TaxID=1882438 RepID=UPI0031A584F5